ncbi:MAG: tRNA (adenosine(37)-N6)-threonylcarbamoyltransferase complex ATPase subunit type 1 TsaE [Gammaproteobacteria bacterium]|nr:tRNA (adenosine(37)-N6)-threonylcarbamoyltransferase complex ATPase subunit type 1 TsaE [Gammaproteobacteria bacterium]
MTYHFHTETDLLHFAEKLATITPAGTVIFLYGSLGAGKTTFARGFLRGLGYEGKVKSPTYTLVEPYDVADKQIFHFDLYRLKSANELEEIGIQDYFSASAICLIEWPDNGMPLLPKPDLACYIVFTTSGRELRLEACTEQGKKILQQLA